MAEKAKTIETEVKSTTEKVTDAPISDLKKLHGKYIIKPVRSTWLRAIDPKHDGALMFSKTEHWVSPERDGTTGLIKTGLTDTMARELEAEMNLKPMELSAYNKEWWANNFKLYGKIPREGLELDLDRSGLDKLKYCYFKASSKVALSENDALNNTLYEYVMTSKEIEARHNNKKIEIKTKAFKKFGEMSLSEQMDFLKVYEEGKYRLTKSASPEFINSTVGRIVDEHPEDFLDLCANADFKTMVFLQDCVSIGAVKKSGSTYYAIGGDKIGSSFLDTIQNLQKPEYDEVKISLLAKIKSTQ